MDLWSLIDQTAPALGGASGPMVDIDPASLAFDCGPTGQRALVLSESRRDVACLPRQAGKTTAAVLRAFVVAERPQSRLVTYVTKTKRNGKRLFWRPLLEVAEKLGYDVKACSSAGDLVFKVPHDDGTFCLIEILGAHDEDQIELMLGTQYDLVIVDEAAYIRPLVLETLLRRVLVPGLRARRGVLLLIGTPGAVKYGPFYDAWANPAWTKFRWTAWDNPSTPAGAIEEEIAELGLNPADAIYVTEYLGEWYDGPDSRRVWAYDPDRDSPDIELPTSADQAGGMWKFSWGVDLASSEHNDALVVWGWRTNDEQRRLYQVDEWEGPGTELIDELEAVLKAKKARWRPSCAVGDQGGHGAKKILRTLAPRLGVNFQDKPTDVEASIRLMNTDFRTGRLKVIRNGKLAQDMQMEVWDVSKTGKRVISGPRHSDVTSSGRYGYTAARAFRSVGDPPAPVDIIEERDRAIRAQIEAEAAARRKGRWR
jgi:hypothetical protein